MLNHDATIHAMRRALRIILAISLVGIAFSGFLVYRELFHAAPLPIGGRCEPVGAPGTILGYPPCVYGLVMYVLVGLTSTLGLVAAGRADREGTP